MGCLAIKEVPLHTKVILNFEVILIFEFIFILKLSIFLIGGWGCLDINVVRLTTGAKGIFLVIDLCDFYHFKGAPFAKPGVKSN